MKKISTISLIAIAFLSSCTLTLKTQDTTPAPQAELIKVAPVSGAANGIVYTLPKTALRFNITAEKVEKKRGEFYLYSERYLGLREVILEDGEEWEIKSIELETYGVADSDEKFQLFVPQGAGIPQIQLSPCGVILGVNTEITLPQQEDVEIKRQSSKPLGVPYTEEMLLANSSAKMAQEAARYIYRLRESRTALLSADLEALPPDGEAYSMSLEEIEELEAQFLSLFQGTETRTCVTESIDIIPGEIKDKEVLFRFSSFGGVVAADDLSGAPYYIKMKTDAEKGETPTDTAGLYYKQPAAVTVTVLEGNTEVLSEKVLMAQFGKLSTLPLGILTKDTKVSFYPKTGAIKAIGKE